VDSRRNRRAVARHVPRAVLTLGLLLAAASASAQLETDSVPFGRTIPPREEMEHDLSTARWKLGPVRILPKIQIREAGYDSNVTSAADDEEKIADWTATVAAGARFILPAGSKLYFRADALPEYTWYLDLEQRRRFGGRYGGGIFAFFNRLGIELSGTTADTVGYLNSESLAQVAEDADGVKAKLEIEFVRNLSFWAAGEVQQRAYEPLDDLPIDVEDPRRLDRDARAVRGGLRYGLRRDLQISVGVEGTRTEFDNQPLISDNESRAWLLGVRYDRPRFYVNAIGGQREGEPYGGSAFPEYSEFTGSGYVSYKPARPLELRLYARRGVIPSVDPDSIYFVESRAGLGASVALSSRFALQGYGEAGTNAYPEITAPGLTSPARRDRIQAFGGGLTVNVTGSLGVNFLAYQTVTDFDGSNEDRSVFRFVTNITFGEILP
jgi:hypothetical protein